MLNIVLTSVMKMQTGLEWWEEEILQAWRDSRDLPRKKKKKRRKELLLDWSICQHGKELFYR